MTGYLATINNLRSSVANWLVSAVPITALLETGRDHGTARALSFTPAAVSRHHHHHHAHHPKVPKNDVLLSSPSYLALASSRSEWAVDDRYENPGPIQYEGECAGTAPLLIELEPFEYLRDIQDLQVALDDVREACRPGCEATVVRIATQNLVALKEILRLVASRK